jgi:hypothetical protein
VDFSTSLISLGELPNKSNKLYFRHYLINMLFPSSRQSIRILSTRSLSKKYIHSHADLSRLPIFPYNELAPDMNFNEDITDVAVLGGGITGLATAYYLTKQYPETKITLLESSSRFGGWLNSTKHHVNNQDLIFELGARTLRPHRITLDLVSSVSKRFRVCDLLIEFRYEIFS